MVHHPVDQQAMLLGINVRRQVAVRIGVMKRRRRDVPHHILKRSHRAKKKAGSFFRSEAAMWNAPTPPMRPEVS